MDSVEFIVEVSKGPLGRVWLGRLLSGSEEGRVVAVRCLPSAMFDAAHMAAVLEAAALARRVKHPTIAKVLSAGLEHDELRIVSEYVEGEYLAGLRALLFRRGRPLAANVVKRVLLDAMRATCLARQELNRFAVPAETRLLFGDTILIARFGETLIADPVVAGRIDRALSGELGSTQDPLRPPEKIAGQDAERAEVFGAALLMLELLVNRPLSAPDQLESALAELEGTTPSGRDLEKSAALASVLSRALASEPGAGFPDLAEFASAIASFGDEVASQIEVQQALEEAAGTRLDSRKSVLDGSIAGPSVSQKRSSSRPTHRPSGANSQRFSHEAPTSSQKTLARGTARANSPSVALPSSLVAAAPATDRGSGAWPGSFSEPSSGASEPPQARSLEASGARARHGQQLAGLALGLAMVSALLAWHSRSSAPALRPDPSTTRVTLSAVRPAPAVVTVAAASAPSAASAASAASATPEEAPNPAAPRSPASHTVARGGTPSPDRGEGIAQASSPTKPSKSVFHPHNISPYQPRGI